MEDKDKQEIPKPTKRSLTEIFNKPPIESRITEPDPNYDLTVKPTIPSAEETQEQLFRAAATRCAIMEEQLASILLTITEGDHRAFIFPMEGVTIENLGNTLAVGSRIEDIKIQDGHSVRIEFLDGIANHAKKLGIDTNRELTIYLHTDEASRKIYEDLSKNDPTVERNSFTHYYFTKSGDHKKSSGINPRMKHLMVKSRKTLYPSFPGNDETNKYAIYESEMTAGDFEIAGKALQMLIDRLTPLMENSE